MKIVQKILSHGLLIAFVAAAFLAYTNRAEWFPQWFGKTGKAAQQLTDTPAVVSVPSSTDSKAPIARMDETDETSSASAEEATTVQPAPAVPAESELETAPRHEPEASDVVEQVLEQSERQPPNDTAKPQSETVDTEPNQSSTVTVPDAAVRPQQAEKTPPAPERAELVASTGTGTTAVRAGDDDDRVKESSPQAVSPADVQLEKQLEEARRRYWQRDMRGAATAYRALSEEHPKNPDVWGEVGNFYFSLRQRALAAQAYFRCVELLVDQGEQARARQLLNVLYQLDAPKARELATRMQQAGG